MSSLTRPVCTALVAFAIGASLRAQDETEPGTARALLDEIKAKSSALIDTRMGMIRPVTVNGEVLGVDQFRREAVFLVGAKAVEGKIAEFFIAEQLEDAIKEGRDPKSFEIADEEVIQDVKEVLEKFQNENPGIDFWDAVRAQYGLEKDQFLYQRKQTVLFDRVFFPGPAKEWPLITREAIIASSGQGDGKQFWENLEKASVDEEGNPRLLPPFWMHLCRGWVQKQLKKWSDIRFPADGVPADTCLIVNGKALKTAEAFDDIKVGLFAQDLQQAMTEVVVRAALKQELAAKGAYPSDEDFRSAFDEYRKQYDETPFTTEVIATAFKGYPSLEAFRQRWRLMLGYERMIEQDINDDNLQAHAEKFAAFFSDGQTNADVIQFLGKDKNSGAWLPDGMVGAQERAEAAMKALEEGADFNEVLAAQGEYYPNDKEKGRLGSQSLNQLRQRLRENEFQDLLNGYSVGTHLFYEAQPGQIVGPMRATDAWYIARVNSRTPPRASVSVQDARQRELVKQDYVNHRFLEWANDVVARAVIE